MDNFNMQYRVATENHPEQSAHLGGLSEAEDEVYSVLLG